ncbi:MAG: hypothetical protein V4510_10750 [bacterium]
MKIVLAAIALSALALLVPTPVAAVGGCVPGTAVCASADGSGASDACAEATWSPNDSAGACNDGGVITVWRCTFINCQAARVDLSKYADL